MRIADVLPMKKALVHAVHAQRAEYERMLAGTFTTDSWARRLNDLEQATFTTSVRGLGFGTLEACEPLWIASAVLPEWLGRLHNSGPIQAGTVSPYVRHGIAFFQEPVFLPSRLPGKVGLEAPDIDWVEDDSADSAVPIRAISWARGLVPRRIGGTGEVGTTPGTMVMTWAHWRDMEPYIRRVHIADGGDGTVSADSRFPMIPLAYASAADGGWFDLEPDGLLERIAYDGDRPETAAKSTAVASVHLLWQMLGEEILILSREEQSHRQRKMMRRMRLRDTSVTTVHLRHRIYDRPAEPGEETRVEWSHRWYVRGHRRRIRDRVTGEIREVWVRPHIKGPEGAPLKVREHVYALDK